VDVDFGVRGGAFNSGIPIETEDNHYFHIQYLTEKHPFTIGPTMGILLNNRFEIRFEAVRSQFRFQGQDTASPFRTSVTDGYIWQYPLLATYHIARGPLQPFGGGGVSFGRSLHATTHTVTPTTSSTAPFKPFSSSTAFYATGGIDYRVSFFSIRPEFRYAHWTSNLANQDDRILFSPSQIEFLIGFSVHPLSLKR
jgi:hypothetical protein